MVEFIANWEAFIVYAMRAKNMLHKPENCRMQQRLSGGTLIVQTLFVRGKFCVNFRTKNFKFCSSFSGVIVDPFCRVVCVMKFTLRGKFIGIIGFLRLRGE
jgi:hypothetical protein